MRCTKALLRVFDDRLKSSMNIDSLEGDNDRMYVESIYLKIF